ncbi:hypothetical protein HNY73_007890 [Argiope bruennichi]|uniref:Uncharacterized protein n=1 Tax=Argiope bruennichi TaxID=94029 RepID=A0A8T0F727_ARGBR|nr:hypothetical protein HNY73_007890 [Argiope bruennichi]
MKDRRRHSSKVNSQQYSHTSFAFWVCGSWDIRKLFPSVGQMGWWLARKVQEALFKKVKCFGEKLWFIAVWMRKNIEELIPG